MGSEAEPKALYGPIGPKARWESEGETLSQSGIAEGRSPLLGYGAKPRTGVWGGAPGSLGVQRAIALWEGVGRSPTFFLLPLPPKAGRGQGMVRGPHLCGDLHEIGRSDSAAGAEALP